MAQHQTLAQFEFFVLLAIVALGDEAYGVSVRRFIDDNTGRETALGAVYMALRRLHKKGLIEKHLGEPLPERGGRARTYFRVTTSGDAELERAETTVRSMLDASAAAR